MMQIRWMASHGAARFLGSLAAIAMLASCSTRKEPPTIAPPIVPTLPPPSVPTAPDMEAVWHVRSALNVGALSCRGAFDGLAIQYNQMLVRHEEVLAEAYQSEQRRFPVKELDRHLTQIYNRFANQKSPPIYCRTVSAVLSRVLAADSEQFSLAAPVWLRELEAAL